MACVRCNYDWDLEIYSQPLTSERQCRESLMYSVTFMAMARGVGTCRRPNSQLTPPTIFRRSEQILRKCTLGCWAALNWYGGRGAR